MLAVTSMTIRFGFVSILLIIEILGVQWFWYYNCDMLRIDYYVVIDKERDGQIEFI